MSNNSSNLIKTIVKILIIILLVCFVLPMFTVSCSGQNVNVSAAHSVVGYKVEGIGDVADPVVVLLLLLVFPAVMLAVGGIKKRFTKVEGICNIVLALFEMIGYMMFKSGVRDYAKKNACSFETNGLYYLTIALCVGVIIGYVIIMICERSPGIAPVGSLHNPIAAPGPGQTFVPQGGWTCTCGNVLRDDDLFCGKCGNRKPE